MGSSTATPIRLEFLIDTSKVKGALSPAEAQLRDFANRGGKYLDDLAQRAERTAKSFAKLSTAMTAAGVGGAVAGQVSAQSYASATTASLLRNANRFPSPLAGRPGAIPAAPVPAGIPANTAAPARVNPATAWMSSVYAQLTGNPFGTMTSAVGPLKQLASVLGSIGNGMQSIGASLYVLERAGRALRGLAQPYVDFAKDLIETTDRNRKFELAISGVVGGAGKARAVNDQVYQLAKTSPLSVDDLQEVTRGMTAIPTLASRMASGNVADIRDQIKDYAGLVNKLAILDPVQGAKGAGVALREAMAGEFRSLRLRFEVSPEQIARTIGKTLDDLERDPNLALKAVNAFTDIFIPPESLDNASKLFSQRLEKLQDNWREFLRGIGESGIYDGAVAKLQGLSDALNAYLGSDRYKSQAARVSKALSGILDTAAESVRRFLEAATGSKADSVGGVIEGATRLVEMLADSSKGLIPIAENIGAFVNRIAGALDKLGSGLDRMKGYAGEFEPGNAPARFLKGLAFDDRLSVEDMRREAISRVLRNAGLSAPGVQYVRGATPMDALRSEGFGAYLGQVARNFYTGSPGEGESAPVLDFGRYGPKVATVAYNLQRVVDQLDEATLHNSAALQSALRESGVLDKLANALGKATTRPSTPELDEIIKREGIVPNFAAQTSSAIQLLGRVSAFRNSERDPLSRLLAQAGGAFTGNLGSGRDPYTLADVLKRLDKAFDAEADKYVRAMEQATSPGQADQVRRDFGKLQDRYAAASKQIKDQLVGSAQDYGVALAESLGDLAPNVKAIILARATDGTTSFAQKVKDVLVAAGENAGDIAQRLRYDSLPLRDRLKLQSERTGARIGDIERGYPIEAGASADDIRRVVMRGKQPDYLIGDRVGEYIQNDPRALPEQIRLYNEALSKFNPMDEDSVIRLGEAQDKLVALTEKLREAADASNFAKQALDGFASEAKDVLTSSLGDAFYDLITGAHEFEDVWRSLVKNMVRAWSDAMSKMVVNSLWAKIAGAVMGGAAGGGAGKFNASNGSFGSAGADFGSANGNVVRGGIRFFANGSPRISSPTLGLVGEGRYNEAIIPLPDGRSVPVQMRGGEDRQQQNVYVVYSPEEAFARGYRKNRDLIVNTIASDLKGGGKTKRAITRKQ